MIIIHLVTRRHTRRESRRGVADLRYKRAASLVLLAGGVACSHAQAGGARGPAVSGISPVAVREADLVAEISRYVCARWSAEDSAWMAAFADPHCVRGDAEGTVAGAVRQAMFDVQPIIRLSEDAYPSAYRSSNRPRTPRQGRRRGCCRRSGGKTRCSGRTLFGVRSCS